MIGSFVGVLLTLSIVASAEAQVPPLSDALRAMNATAQLKVVTRGSPFYGQVARVTADSVVMRTSAGFTKLPLLEINAIYERRTSSKLGFQFGAAIGGTFGAILGRQAWQGINDNPTSGIPGLFLGGLIGAGLGGLFGAMFGEMVPRWVPVWP
jgi:hypothetical protein